MEINNKFSCCIVLFLASVGHYAIAQTTSYYSLTKIDEYGKVKSKCNGGQFVKVSKNICFDTDYEGNDIGNGKLYRDVNNYSNSHVYAGDSFHGKARYIFSADYSELTVEINPHFKYYYSRTAAPKGIVTSSLIKYKGSRNEIIPNGPNHGTQYNNNYNNNGTNQSNINNNNSYNSGSNSNSNVNAPSKKFKCAYCNGIGRIEKNDNAPANFGTDRPQTRCNECGKWYDPDVFTHYHLQCRYCGGTGYAK